jgi:predicted permease
VAAQVALSLVVVFGAALFTRSLRNLNHAELGFDKEHVLTVWINPRVAGYGADRLPGLYRRLIDRMEAVPGVRSAAVSMCGLAVECRSTSGTRVSGYEARDREDVRTQFSFVSPGYFPTVGVRLLQGRDFDTHDKGSRVAIVNEAFVRRYFAHRSPLEQHIGQPGSGARASQLGSEIIGVAGDARVNRVSEPAVPMAWWPLEGNLVYAGSLEVRAVGNPQILTADVRKALTEAAADLPVERITSLSQQVDGSLKQERLIAILTAAFGILALGLACFGLYGVMSYLVTRRTSEIGVRMALGARPAQIVSKILAEVFRLIALGLAVGLPVLFFASRSLSSLLYGVTPNDPAALLAIISVLTGVAALAGLLPAIRASRINPVAALRQE